MAQPKSQQLFGYLVRKARKRRGWSMRDLADALDIDHNVIYRIEHGRSDPPLSLAAKLSRVLDLSLDAVA